MWPFGRNNSSRRRLRDSAVAPVAGRWRRFREAGGPIALLLAAAFYVAVAFMDLWPTSPLEYRLGQYVPSDIYSRVTFHVLSPSSRDNYINWKQSTTPAVFRFNSQAAEEILSTLAALPQQLAATTQPADLDKPLVERFGITSAEALAAWRAYAEPASRAAWEKQLAALRERLEQTPMVEAEAAKTQRTERLAQDVSLGAGKRERLVPKADLFDRSDKDRLQRAIEQLAEVFDPTIRPNVRTYLEGTLPRGEVLYRYDAAATQQKLNKVEQDVRDNPPSDVYDEYEAGKLLVRGGVERDGQPRLLDDMGLELLRHEHQAYLKSLRQHRPMAVWGQLVGRALVLLLVVALLCLYVARYQRPLLHRHWRTLAVTIVLALMLGMVKVMNQMLLWDPHTAVLPVLVGAMLLAIAFDQRFALTLAWLLSLLVVLQLRSDIPMFIVLATAAAAALFPLREIRTRSKIIQVAALSAAAVFVAVWGDAMLKLMPPRPALYASMWGAGFALLAGFLVQGALPAIERVFRVATSMTLLEWCDASKPLLRRLAMEAPGTYSHSLQLGAMCEAAAEAIGARGLLARVGAYYHDIGKINKPDYFSENEAGGTSRHAKLSPAMSLLVITGHVKDGLELARRYALPRVLWEFIAAHHGTTLMEYFYRIAAEQRRGDADRAPDEAEFRYPGPKPVSREVAILLLADASESSVRSMGDPTPGRVENQVHAMVTRRLMDGQLDECELTLREVHEIEKSIVKSLCGIYHSRVAYPTPEGQKPSAAEMPRPNEPAKPAVATDGDEEPAAK